MNTCHVLNYVGLVCLGVRVVLNKLARLKANFLLGKLPDILEGLITRTSAREFRVPFMNTCTLKVPINLPFGKRVVKKSRSHSYLMSLIM